MSVSLRLNFNLSVNKKVWDTMVFFLLMRITIAYANNNSLWDTNMGMRIVQLYGFFKQFVCIFPIKLFIYKTL